MEESKSGRKKEKSSRKRKRKKKKKRSRKRGREEMNDDGGGGGNGDIEERQGRATRSRFNTSYRQSKGKAAAPAQLEQRVIFPLLCADVKSHRNDSSAGYSIASSPIIKPCCSSSSVSPTSSTERRCTLAAQANFTHQQQQQLSTHMLDTLCDWFKDEIDSLDADAPPADSQQPSPSAITTSSSLLPMPASSIDSSSSSFSYGASQPTALLPLPESLLQLLEKPKQ